MRRSGSPLLTLAMSLACTLALGLPLASAQSPALAVPTVLSLPAPSTFTPSGGVALDAGGNIYFSGSTRTAGQFLWSYNRLTGQLSPVASGSSIASAQSLATDRQGNLYVADATANKIWKVTPAGAVSALASTSSGAPALALAIDPDGDLLFATSTEVFEIAAANGIPGAGAPQVIAGGGPSALSNGTIKSKQATDLRLQPSGVATDAAGNIYIALVQNEIVAKLAGGKLQIVAGQLNQSSGGGNGKGGKGDDDNHGQNYNGNNNNSSNNGDGGPATSAYLYGPRAITADSAGNLYIAENNGLDIREVYASTGVIVTLAGDGNQARRAGQGDGGLASQAEFLNASALAIGPAGDLFVSDAGSSTGTIREITARGDFPATAVGAASASQTLAIQLTASQRATQITVTGNGFTLSTVQGCTLGAQVWGFSFNGGNPAGTVCLVPITFTPSAAGLQTGAVTISDNGQNPVSFPLTGIGLGPEVMIQPPQAATLPGENIPSLAGALATDGFGNLFVLARPGGSTQPVYDYKLQSHSQASFAGSGIAGAYNGPGSGGDGGPASAASFQNPSALAADAAGNLFIADTGDHAVREVSAATGNIVTYAGNGKSGNKGDLGPALSAQLNAPAAVAAGPFGNLFISDSGNNNIRKVFASSGAITTLVVQLDHPGALAADTQGDLYFLNHNGAQLEEWIAATQSVVTLAGSTTAGFADGAAASALFNQASALAVDAAGDVYIADQGNDRVRLYSPASQTVSTVYQGKAPAGVAIGQDGTVYVSIADSNGTQGLQALTSSTAMAPLSAVVNSTSPAGTAVLRNAGNQPLNFSALTVSGAGFALAAAHDAQACTASSGNTLAAAATCSLDVTYTAATTVGSVSGTLSLTDNAPNSPQSVALTGTTTATQPTKLVFSPAPPAATTSALPSLTVLLEDSNGHQTTSTDSLVAVLSGPSSFTHTLAAVAAVNGSATLDLTGVSLPVAGAYSITVSDSTNPEVTSAQVTITVSAPGSGGSHMPPPPKITLPPLTFTFSQTAAVAAIQVYTQGVTGMDYTRDTSTPGTCILKTYSPGQSCTVIVDFQQTAVGPRAGAVVLFDANNHALQTQYLSQTGTGALTTFDTAPVPDPVQPAFDNSTLQLAPVQLALDPAGDMFVADLRGNDVTELQPSSPGGAINTSNPIALGANINTWGLPIQGVALDGAGNLYLLYPDAVYEVPNENGTLSSADYTTVAQVNLWSGHWLSSIAADGQGNVYVADLFAGLFKAAPGSNTLQQIASDVLPYGAALVTADAAGNLFASDGVCNVFKISASGSDSKVVPSPGPGSLLCYSGLGTDAAGDLLLASNATVQIYEIRPDASQTVIAQAPSGHFVFAPLFDSSANVYYDDFVRTGGLLSGTNTNTVEKVTRSAPSIIFGNVTQGNPNSQVSVTMANAGNLNLQVSSLQLGGNDPSVFSFAPAASNGCSTASPVNPGTACEFLATFTPSIPGAASATETITDNTRPSPHVLPLNGNGNGVDNAAKVAFTSTLPAGLTAPAPLGNITVQVEDAAGNIITGSDGITVTVTGSGQTLTATGTAGQPITLGTVTNGGIYTLTATDTSETNLAPAIATIYVAAPAIAVGQSSASGQSGSAGVVQIADFSFGTSRETVSSITVTTLGATGQDFTRDPSDTGAGACATGANYQNAACTVMVDFKPAAPGLRAGAVTVTTNTGTHTLYISRMATAPLVTVDVPTPAPVVVATNVDASSLALDGGGNLYLTDPVHATVLEQQNPAQCTSNCQTQISAGSWSKPSGIAVDGAGNLYVADQGSGLVEGLATGTSKLTPLQHFGANTVPIAVAVTGSGIVYAGNNTAQSLAAACAMNSSCSAPATVTGLGANLTSIVADASGNLYFPGSGAVEKLAAGATSPTALATGFTGPLSLAVDAAGDVYALDSGAGTLTEIFPSGTKATLVTGLTPATSLAGLTIDGFGNIYYANLAANEVVEIERSSTTTLPIATVSLSTSYGTAGQGTFSVSNSGNAVLNLTSVAISGTGFSQNAAATNCSTSLASGLACTEAVTLGATTPAGSYTGAATLADNSLNATVSQSVTLTGSVTGGTQTITFPNPAGLLYGSSVTLAATASSGLPVSYAIAAGGTGTGTLTTTGGVTTLAATKAGTINVTASQTGSSSYTAAKPVTVTITAAPVPLTITAASVSVTYGGTPSYTSTVTGSLVGNDAITETYATSSANGVYTTTSSAGSTFTITPTAVAGANTLLSNYDLTIATGALTVNKATQTISFTAPTTPLNYGGSVQLHATGGGSTQPVTFSTSGGATIATANGVTTLTATAAGSISVTASQAGDTNYLAATPVTVTLTAAPVALTIAARSESIAYGATPSYTSTVTGTLVSTDAITETYAALSTVNQAPYTTTSAPGTFTITPTAVAGTGTLLSNYTITLQPGTLTVTQGSQTTNFSPSTSMLYGDHQILSATTSSQLPVTFAVANGTGTAALATVNGVTTLTATKAGTFTVTASQAGNTDYTAATPVAVTITAAPVPLTITAANVSVAYGATPSYTSTVTGTLVGTDAISETYATSSANGPYSTTSAAGTSFTITPTAVGGTNTLLSNYDIAIKTGTLTVTTATASAITFTGPTTSLRYGSSVALSASGGIPNVPITFAVTNGTGAATVATSGSTTTLTVTKAGTFSVTASQAASSNYSTPAAITVNLTAAPVPLTITAANVSVAYGATPSYTSTVSGALVGTDAISETYTTSSANGTYSTTSAAGSTFTITPAAVAGTNTLLSNYDITNKTGTLTVTTATAPAIVFAGPMVPLSYGSSVALSASGGIPNVSITFAVTNGTGAARVATSGSTTTLTVTKAGTFSVTASQAASSNYSTPAAITVNLTAAPVPLTITAANISVAYGATPSYTSTVSGALVGTDAISETYATSSANGAYTTTSAAGTSFTITPTAVGGTNTLLSNYEITLKTGTLTVTTATAPAITFTGPTTSLSYGSSVALSASGGIPNVPITFAVTNGTGAATVATSGSTTTLTVTKAGTFSVTASQAASSNYSTPAPVTVPLTAAPVPLTITAANISVAYGATPSYTSTVTGTLVGTDAISETYATSSANGAYSTTSAAGSSFTITPTAVAGVNTLLSNYDVTVKTGTLTVTTATAPAITFTGPTTSLRYGSSVALSASGGIPTVPITFAVTNGTGSARVATSGSTTTLTVTKAGTFTVTASQAASTNYSTPAAITVNLTAAPVPLTLTAANVSVAYGGTPAYTSTVTGTLVGSDAITETYTTSSANGSYTTTSAAGTTFTITPAAVAGTNTLLSNYAITIKTGTLTVTTATAPAIVFTGPSGPLSYGSAVQLSATGGIPNVPITFAVTNGTGAATIATASGTTTLTVTKAGTFTVTASQAASANYTAPAAVTVNLTAAPVALTITAADVSVAYGGTPAYTSTLTGTLVGTDAISETYTTSSANGPYTTTSAAGTTFTTTPAAVAGTGTLLSNYAITIKSGTLTVTTAAAAAISFTGPSGPLSYGSTVTLSASGGIPNTPITFAVTDGTGAATITTTGGTTTLTVTRAGTFSVTASQTASANYRAPASVTVNLTAAPVALTITAANVSVAYGGTPAYTSTVTGTLVGSDAITETYTTSSANGPYTTTSAAGSTFTITPKAAAGNGTTNLANYTITYQTGTLTVTTATAAAIVFTAPAQSLSYGGSVALSASGGIPNVPITFAVPAGQGTITPGPTDTATLTASVAGTIEVTASQAASANYKAPSPVTVPVTAAPAVLTATAQNATRIFGASNPSFSTVITGFVNGDTQSVVHGTVQWTTTAGPTSDVGQYPITAGSEGLNAANYTFHYVGGTLQITQAAQTVNFSSIPNHAQQDQPFSIQASATSGLPLTFTITGPATISGNTVTLTGATGTVAITASQAGNNDYTAAPSVTQSFTVGQGVFLSTADLNFGSVQIDQVSIAQTIFVTNSSDRAISALPQIPPGFTYNGDCSASLGPNRSCSVNVSFAPTAIGPANGTVVIMGMQVTVAGIGTQPGLEVGPTDMIFGSQLVGSVSPTQTLTVTNNGSANLVLAPVTISGDFQETSQCSTTRVLRPGDSCLVSVSFAPSTKGDRSGTLTVTSRDGSLSAQAALSGTGTVPSAVNGAILNPANLFFGGEPVNQPSQAQTITVTNPNANDALAISSITASGDFSEVTNCPQSLPANGVCVINVTVTPSTVGSRTGTLTVNDNIGSHIVALSALGQAATAAVSPTHLAFGSQPIPGSNLTYNGTAQIATLANTGSAALAIKSISVTGDFTQTNTCGSTLAANSSCTIAITFAPSALGHRTGTLTITDNAGGASSQQQVAVEGNGSVNGLVLAPPLLRFGTVPVGQTSESQTSTLTNGTGQPITGLTITASGEFSETDNCGSTLANGASCQVTVTLTPAISGAATGSITFNGSFNNTSGAPGGTETVSNFFAESYEMPHMEPARYVIGAASTSSSLGFRVQPRVLAEMNAMLAATRTRREASLPLFATLNDLATVALSGSGSSTTANKSAPSLHASPGIMSWSAGEAIGHSGTAQTITITNSGQQALTGMVISSSAEFPITANQCGSVLVGGASCSISVAFQPSSTGPRAGTLSIAGGGGVSDQVPLNGTGSDFTIAAAGGAPLLSAGSSVQIPLSLNSIAGDQQTITMTCSVSGGATCSVAPASVSIGGPAAVIAQLTVTSSAASVPWPGAGNGRWPWAVAAAALVALALCFLLADADERRRRWKAAMIAGALTFSVACGGLGNPETAKKEEQNSMLSASAMTATVNAVSSTGMMHNVTLTIPVGGLQVRNHNQQDQNQGQNPAGTTTPPPASNVPNTSVIPAEPEKSSTPAVTSNPAAPGAKLAQNCVETKKGAETKAPSEASKNGQDKNKPANNCPPVAPKAKKPPGSPGGGGSDSGLRARL